MTELRRVCVFCGSSDGNDARHVETAAELGRLLAARGLGLVYGGGSVGLMGTVADAVLAAGGEAIGVIPTGLFRTEVGHTGLTELHQVPDMHSRKALMYDLADGFCVLPGGLGTMEELFEAATWNQLGLHGRIKPIVLVDDGGYWRPVIDLLDAAVEQAFVRPRWRSLIADAPEPAGALDVLATMVRHAEDDPQWELGPQDKTQPRPA